MTDESVRAIAFYLPQFHPIPENDAWWGQGFTEWTNVAKARPLFRGHYQPHLPADLGFYDLRLPETREAQAQLACEHGISGFCYYHYWFHGRRLLERPFQEVLESGRPKFPFCLCWANEPWTRRWLGEGQDILIPQTYSREDDEAHSEYLSSVFSDERYITVGKRPVFLMYRPDRHPDPIRFTTFLKNAARRATGNEPYLIASDAGHPDQDNRKFGFDTTLHFEPQLGALPGAMDDRPSITRLARNLKLGVLSGRLKLYEYVEARRKMTPCFRQFPQIPCVLAGWDNSPRRGKFGSICVGAHPASFGRELRRSLADWKKSSFRQDNLIFINAWNEWAEGNHLEPDQKWGMGYLNELRSALEDFNDDA
jgi:lipopolysaccharide biosynthesis protein